MFTIETIKKEFGEKKTEELINSYRKIVRPIMTEAKKDQEERIKAFILEAHKILKKAPATPAQVIAKKVTRDKYWDLTNIMAFYMFKYTEE